MRTNIVLDDRLMRSALKASGLKTKKDAIVEALNLLIRMKAQQGVKRCRGKLKWDGDLEQMRLD